MNSTTISASTVHSKSNEDLLNLALDRCEIASRNDPDLRRSAPLAGVIEDLESDRLDAIDVFARACAAYSQRPALGERAFVLDRIPGGRMVRFLPEFRTITYGTVWQRTVDVATGLARDPRIALRAGEVAGICGFGSIDYVVADLACLYAGVASAMLPMGLATGELRHIVKDGGFAAIVCSIDSLPAVVAVLPECPSVRGVVVMDIHGEGSEEAATLAQARARTALPLPTLAEIACVGHLAAPLAPFPPAPGTDPLATLMYTSGSTGFPKGAMLTQSIWRSHWSLASLPQVTRFPCISINFYPLGHAMGRNSVMRSLVLGGTMHFTLKNDMSTLFEDIRLVRPTFLALVPRISEMIHQAYRSEVQRRLKGGAALPAAQAQVRAAMRSTFLGDRLLAALIASAPTAPEVVEFLTGCFEIPVYEGYGSTEGGIVTVDGGICRPLVSAYKLVDVPDLGYRGSDKPFPRGELRIKTRQCIPGYFRNEAATRDLYDEEGFLGTGDIVEERGPDEIAWIDRRNNVVKLSQGEYVTLWRLESAFSGGSPLLDQVYLYANSQRAYLLAVVVPEWAAVKERLRLEGREAAPSEVKRLLRLELNRVAGEAQLRAYEVPRDFLVEEEPWTRENGFLTGINKPARPQLKLRYGERLEALYVRIEELQHRDLADMGADGKPAPPAEALRKAAAAVLGVPDLDPASGSFKDLGGDSISALSLSLSLENLWGAPVPVSAILDPGRPLAALVGLMAAQGSQGRDALPGFSAIHGGDPAAIRAEDLRLDRFLGPEDRAAPVAAQPLTPVRTVLLTGANGFLGHILCLEWLEEMAKVGGKVYGLVRAPDDRAAAARLRAACHGDPALEQRFASLADHLVVLAGDLVAPGLGIPAGVHGRLAEEVDLIVHQGAMVNHVFSYEQLFAPNVLGTAQLIRLALLAHRKRIDYVSTIGVLAGARVPGRVSELAGVDALQTVWPVAGEYAHGYATSKWACEVLLKELHGRFGTSVRVFRPGMILPHRRYRGQANVLDMLTRLLLSLIHTGLAPRSFHPGGPGAPAHYDGLPVDFVASAMVSLSSAFQDGLATYQVSNAHWDDGVSLDSLVDWVESAGYPLERIGDHAAWFEAFRARLEALPAPRRQRSVLPILQPWATPGPGADGARVDASQFRQEVWRRRPGGEAEIPHLSEGYLHKYLADLRALGLLGTPDGEGRG